MRKSRRRVPAARKWRGSSANRDTQLKARFEELAQLQREIVRSDPSLRIRRAFGRLKRRLRGATG
jgi:hypothetical protein